MCAACGANLRSIALANAIRDVVGTRMTLREFVKTSEAGRLTVLEINEAGTLSPILQQPHASDLSAIDIHAMPHAGDAFDRVIHSDMLEHIANPIRARAECRRVLQPWAALCFTIRTIVERLSRSREGTQMSTPTTLWRILSSVPTCGRSLFERLGTFNQRRGLSCSARTKRSERHSCVM